MTHVFTGVRMYNKLPGLYTSLIGNIRTDTFKIANPKIITATFDMPERIHPFLDT
jgi:hypothetical protein